MTDQEIMTKAIEKAIAGGWKGVQCSKCSIGDRTYYYPNSSDLLKWRWEDDGKVFSGGECEDYDSINIETIIYSHDFAKALWGETETTPEQMYGGSNRHTVNWKWHLAEMVIAEDPIKYLGENI